MLFFGFNVPANKILVSVSPITITALRVFTAGLIVFIILGFMGKIRKPSSGEWKFIILGSLLNIVGHHIFLSTGLTETTSTNAGLILGIGPVLTAILSTVLLRKIPTFIQILGFVLGSIGVLFIVLSGEGGLAGLSSGDLFVFLSILSLALSSIVISKAAKTLDPRVLTGYMLILGSVILFFIGLWREPTGLQDIAHAPYYAWITFFSSAILSTAVGQMVYNSAIGELALQRPPFFSI